MKNILIKTCIDPLTMKPELIINLFLLVLILFNPSGFLAFADEINNNDLLIPDISKSNRSVINDNERSVEQKQDIDELLGPSQIFPFLPDNHRDSGTGKFNAF